MGVGGRAMSEQLSLAEIRAKAHEAPDHVFCCNLPLYVLLEKRPRPNAPDWVEVGCWKQDEAEGMMVYLSLIDAMIDLYSRNRDGRRYQIFPFESIDSRPFINGHEGWLTVYLAYGFAARSGGLLLSEKGEPMSLMQGTHFQIAPDATEHFHLQFGDKLLAWLDRLHEKAGIPDYGRVALEHAEASSAELNELAQEALRRITTHNSMQTESSHCALYDPIEQEWRLVDFADLSMQEAR